MNIRITFIAADETSMPAKGKGQGYSQLEVTYKDDKGQTKSKKVMSFANPAVFSTLKGANKGDQFDIEMVKNGEFWNWTSATPVDGSQPAPTVSNSGAKTVINNSVGSPGRSNFETPEERALRQRLIVRQSSLAQAIEFMGREVPLDTVLDIAEKMHDWVYQKPDLFQQPNDLDNDLPF